MERMTESTKAAVDHFGEHIVLRQRDAQHVGFLRLRGNGRRAGCHAERRHPGLHRHLRHRSRPAVDLVYAMTEAGLCDNHDLVERMETRHGLRQLTYMKELGMGNWTVPPARPGQRRSRAHPSRSRSAR